MSQHQSKGRRTPLTLGQHHKSTGSGGNSRSNTPTVAADVVAAEVPLKAAREVVGPRSAKENALRLRMAAATAAVATVPAVSAADSSSSDDVIFVEDVQTNDAVATATADKKTREKAPRKESVVPAKSPTSTNGSNGKPAELPLPPAVVNPAVAVAVAAVVVPESPRQKTRENRVKEAEAREIAAAVADFQALDESAAVTVSSALPSTPEKSTTNRRGTRAAPANNSHTSPSVTPTKAKVSLKASPKTVTPTKPAAAAVNVNDVLASTDMDDVMESLQMDSDVDALVDAVTAKPTAAAGVPLSPAKTTADDDSQLSTGKILKFSQSPAAVAAADDTAVAAPRSRLSPYATRRRLSTEDSHAAVAANVNLSTVSERSNEFTNSPAVAAAAASSTRPVGLPTSLRQISGRRSTRPLREVALQQASTSAAAAAASSTSTETYRRVRTELDDSISSMNVTIGSVHDHESVELTAAAAPKGRKRAGAALGGSEPDLQTVGLLVAESPKKPRLDLSGFFGMMASPVTLLRNKFSRTSLLCSTPVKLNVDAAEVEEDEDAEVEEELDLLAEAIEDVPAAGDGADVNMIVEDDVEAIVAMGADKTDVEAEIAEAMQPADDGGADGEGDEAADIVVEAEQPEEIAEDVPTKAKRSNCLIM